MDYHEYCDTKSAAMGYCWPYIKLYISGDKHTALNTALAFRRELEELAERQLDPEIAQLRLHWWRNEINQNKTTPSQHPILQAVAHYELESVMTPERLLRMVNATEITLDPSVTINEEQITSHANNGAGALYEMLAELCGGDEPAVKATSNLGIAEQLLTMGGLYASSCELAHDQAPRIQLATKYINSFYEQQTTRDYRMLPAVWVAAKLLDASARLENFHPQYSPLRANWISWRAARQASQMKLENEKT